MKQGLSRFEFYLSTFETMLSQSAREHNPALWLYRNDARTTIFMLEGLSKIYAGLHNQNRFLKIKSWFKILEDALGQVDFYEAYAKEFLKEPHIPADIRLYTEAQAREKLQHLNELLTEKEWIGENARRMKKIRKKLAEANWLDDDEEITAMAAFYKEAITGIKAFSAATNHVYSEVENQVHELRRKLRWLSIYPRALQGAIQLTAPPHTEALFQKYLTPEITGSPFNVMPEPGPNRVVLQLDKNCFYALSWMIASLGKVKDNSLRILALTEAIQQLNKTGQDAAMHSATTMLGTQHPGLNAFLQQASEVCKIYFDEGTLDRLVLGKRNIN